MCFFGTDTFGRCLLISAAEGGGPRTGRSRCRSRSVTFLNRFTNSICIQGINPYFLTRVYNQERMWRHARLRLHPTGGEFLKFHHLTGWCKRRNSERVRMRSPHPKTDDCYTKLQEQKDKEAALTPNTPSPGPN